MNCLSLNGDFIHSIAPLMVYLMPIIYFPPWLVIVGAVQIIYAASLPKNQISLGEKQLGCIYIVFFLKYDINCTVSLTPPTTPYRGYI